MTVLNEPKSPNQAPQRTGSAVTAPAADRRHLSTLRQVPRPLRLSLSLGSLGAFEYFPGNDAMSTMTPDTDTASITSALIGTWSYLAAEEPSGIGYFHFAADGRAFMFVHQPEQPDRRIPSRLWYSVESASTLRIRAKGSPEGWTCNYHFDGTTLTLLQPSRSFVCARVSPDEIPAWFSDALADRLQKP